MIIEKFVIGDFNVNCYVVVSEKTNEAVIIDPGYICDELDSYINDKNLCVKYIIFTHGHFDHISGLSHYKERYGASVAISLYDAPCLTDENANFTYPSPYTFVPVKPDMLLEDNDEISVGDMNFRFIQTPGHTKGGLCILCDNVLFSGDTLFYHSIGRTDFSGGDYSLLKASIKKLYRLPDSVLVYPGHGCQTSIGEEKYANPYVRADSYE